MAKIQLTTLAKQKFGEAMEEELLQCSLLKTNLGVGEKAYQTFLDATAGHIQYVGLSLMEQTSSIFFKTDNKVEDGNPLLFSIRGNVNDVPNTGEEPKELSLWKSVGGGSGNVKVGAVIPLDYSKQSVDTGLMVREISIVVKGDYE